MQMSKKNPMNVGRQQKLNKKEVDEKVMARFEI
jgi:hypothetical protein